MRKRRGAEATRTGSESRLRPAKPREKQAVGASITGTPDGGGPLCRTEPGAGAAAGAQDWRWSSVRAHMAARDDARATVAPLLGRCSFRFGDLIDAEASDEATAALRGAETIGRPLGSPAFLDRIAALTGRDPRPQKRGPKAGAIKGIGNVSPPERVGLRGSPSLDFLSGTVFGLLFGYLPGRAFG